MAQPPAISLTTVGFSLCIPLCFVRRRNEELYAGQGGRGPVDRKSYVDFFLRGFRPCYHVRE